MRKWLQHWACGGEQGRGPSSKELGGKYKWWDGGDLRRCGRWGWGILKIYR